jgi:hypothetical protein
MCFMKRAITFFARMAGIPAATAGNDRSRSRLSDSALLHAHIWRVNQGEGMFHGKIEQHWR